jgi:uncharacterized membrane protein
MDHTFWIRMHGGSTHFPIALVITSMLFDMLGYVWPAQTRRREFHAVGFYLIVGAALTSFGAVLSGLVISKWVIVGTGLTAKHHLFAWPAFALMIALATWRLITRREASRRGFAIYLAAMVLTSVLIATAGYWGGEMLIGS